ncbi:unnamed protein product [Spodoptera littoralis]|uniref:Uncharacterized protein n=1 Tax=Spodoptera littoralis TaxID=7109 RepID=A0A9P0I8R9_SPOLI|nr:unnamed protein product [Spodoptera littoralis]CAH1642307.1 unnamed protein product [Spodoptera littoralis]
MHVHYNSFICMHRLMEVTMTKYLYRAPINIYRQLQVDLRKPCHKSIKWERSIADLNKYICKLDDQLTNFHYTVYQMYTTTSNTIGSYIAINEKKIVFTIRIERFDLNSAIVANVKNYLGYDKGELFCYLEITEKDIVTDDNYATMSYSDTERVTFSCDRYTDIAEDISIGLIDSRGDNIQTVIGTLYSELLDVSKNGSMLCCVYYEKTQSDGTQYINRVIANKTLLVCKKNEFNQTETTDADTSLATMEQMVQTFTNYAYLIIPIAVLLTITIITTYICIRKKRNGTEIATERSICENQDVNYATLDLKTSGKKPTQPDEPQYAQIMAASKL